MALSFKVVAQSNWIQIAPYPPRLPQVNSTAVINTKAYFWCEGNLVFSTPDSGNSFTEYPQYAPTNNIANGNNYPMQGIAFADSLTGYIVDLAHGEFRTTDGGWTWTQTGQPGSNITLVAFGSSKIGWKLGSGGFYRTTDAGESWNFISTPLFGDWNHPVVGNFCRIVSLNTNDIWILKSNQLQSGNPGPIWHSTDSGFYWTNLNTGLSSDSTNQTTYEDFVMRPSGIGCITGTIYSPSINFDNIRGFVLTTNNFGVTWKQIDFANEDYNNITSFSDSVWVLLGNTRPHSYDIWGQSIERRTTNMGENWEYSSAFGSDSIQNQHYYTSAYIPKLNTILATTTYGTYKSNDQGRTFPKLTSERDISANFITLDKADSSKSNQIIICPSYGLDYLISLDGGSSWSRKQLPGYIMTTMTDLKVSKGKIYQIVYDYQSSFSIAASTDFGQTWDLFSVPTMGALRGLSVSGGDTIAYQAFPNMDMSTNGGMSWSQGPMLINCWINESQIVGNGKIIAVGGLYDTSGTKGIVYVSSDGGFDWRIQDFPAELAHIKMITKTTGFVAGADSKLYRTKDGGMTWSVVLSDVNTFAFFDSLRGIASNLQITLDGGTTWKPSGLSSPTAGNITSMEFNNSGDLFAVANSNLFKYINAISMFPPVSYFNQNFSQLHSIILEQNNPNPFNPSTNISFSLPSTQLVHLVVYDILGREVKKLFEGTLLAGKYSIVFDGSSISSGLYFYRLTAENFSVTKKMLLIK
ncbi:MAG: T9SS type A sorting domain-containing protein [Ignavibacteriaceae bacterium]